MKKLKLNLWIRRQQKYLIAFFFVFVAVFVHADQQKPYTLTLAHINDTHSQLEPLAARLVLNGEMITVELGGFARLKTALDEMRKNYPHLLLLHAGDAMQGSLYFTLFNGDVDVDFLNLLKVDAFAFGNHEFDRGVKPIADWIKRSSFPWLSANIDFSGEPVIASLVHPYLIREIKGERIAIIGVTTEATPQITLDVGRAVFQDPAVSVLRQVETLTAMGINKIILLSHLGYVQDIDLARQVSGIDVIVGGHSHSLLGNEQNLSGLNLTPAGPYPTEVQAPDGSRVLVLQAWQWGHALGKLQADFNSAGTIVGYKAQMTIPVGDRFLRNNLTVPKDSEDYKMIAQRLLGSGVAFIYPENTEAAALLAPYKSRVDEYRRVKVATAAEDLVRGLNSGPGQLAADSLLLAVPHAQISLLNKGGVRQNILAGDIKQSDILAVLPFNNTVVLLDLTGAQIKLSLEEGIDYRLTRYPGLALPHMPYVAGIRFSVRPSAAFGKRVSNLTVKNNGIYQPIQTEAVYRLVTNSFVAAGRDGFATIGKASGFRHDTGLIDNTVFRDHLQKIGLVKNPTKQQIEIIE